MAPPPPADAPLGERLAKVATTLQFAWFCGHFTLLLSVFRYGLSYLTFNYYSRWAQVTYRLAFISAVATYGIVVFKAYRARVKPGAKIGSTAFLLLSDENVQYLLYSVFHVATYTRTIIIPTFQPPKATASSTPASPSASKPAQSPLANSIGRFVKEYYDGSMMLVALLEIALWFRLLMSALTFSKGSWILLGIYTVFLRARYSQSQFVQGAFLQMGARIDQQVQNPNVPPVLRQVWDTIKGLLRQTVEATDMRKYIGGQTPQKKPQ
ncbi:hypothetical protein AYO22_05977 [Fonsecaea multimorphosa]|nr:hypothetical protein AYO22_05977 [Fonsecaea multimorphosa]